MLSNLFRLTWVFVAVAALTSIACDDDDEQAPTTTSEASQTATSTSIPQSEALLYVTPAAGPIGSDVTITGEGFERPIGALVFTCDQGMAITAGAATIFVGTPQPSFQVEWTIPASLEPRQGEGGGPTPLGQCAFTTRPPYQGVGFLVTTRSLDDPKTGIAQLDAASDYLRSHAIDALMSIVQMTPLGCASTPEIGGPPTCIPGGEGASVDTFAVGQCEGAHVTSLEAVRETLVDALGNGDSSIYAVVETQASIPRDDGYWIVVNESAQPSGSADATVWHFDRGANLVGLLLGCTSRHAADRVEEMFPQGRFLLGPEG
jgi:hypothetical protein